MSNSILFLALGAMILVAIGAMAYGVYIFLNPSRTASDRLRDMSGETQEVEAFTVISQEGESSGLASRLGKLAAPTSEEEKSRQRLLLLQAGYKSRHALEVFNSVRMTLALCLPLFVIPISASMGLTKLAFAVVIAAAAGYYGPAMMVRNSVEKRQATLLRSFPDSLDLLVSSVEAGLGLDAAFRRVSTEMEAAAPELAREFQLVNHEISAGVSRVEALRHLEKRTGLNEVRSLVNMLAQAERFGTSVAKSLRVHARVTRERRMSKAEEEAAKVSPKLTVIMILFLLPVLGAILMGPAAINVKNTFSGS